MQVTGLGVLAETSPVRDVVPVGSLVVSFAALIVALWALLRTRAAERRASYPRVSVELNWNDVHDYEVGQPLEPNRDGFLEFEHERRARSLALGIRSRGDLGFEEMRARVRFRRRCCLRFLSTPWTAVDIPDPEPDATGQYVTYTFTALGNWSVRKVALKLGALTTMGNRLWAPEPPTMRLVPVLGAIREWGSYRAMRRRGEDSVRTFQWAEKNKPWWWHVHLLQVHLVRLLDRRDPSSSIAVTTQVACRVAQLEANRFRRHFYYAA